MRDLYLALGDDRGSGRWTVRAYVSRWRRSSGWAALVMALGGVLEPVGPACACGAAAPRRRGAAGRMKRLLFLLLLLAAALLLAASGAVARAGRRTPSPIRRWKRAPAHLQRQLRCLVCQGESIDESGAALAADLRHLVRQQIADGRSDQQIEDYLVARYGDFILMKPPLAAGHLCFCGWRPFWCLIGAGGVAILV